MKKLVLAFALVVSVVGFAARAHADTGYPCSVVFRPPTSSSTAGSYGYILTEMWSGPYCSGSLLKFVSAYSVNATTVDADSKWLYRELPLMTLYRNLVDAALRGGRVLYFPTANGNGLKYAVFSAQY
jgi:hypothetical protein